tara:strand:+ start:10656 stop:12161 length:1506 start_codon:yes stop_codon:yes gene_type:complete
MDYKWTSSSKKKFALIVLIYLIIYCIQSLLKMKEYMDNNWKEARCQPHIIPIAGLSNNAEGSGFLSKTYNNFNSCTSKVVKNTVSKSLKPTLSVTKGTGKGMGSIKTVLNMFRKMSAVLRQMFSSLVGNTINRMSNSYAAIIYFQEKIKTIIKKQSAMFEVISQFSATMPMIIYSFTHGPISRFGHWMANFGVALIALLVICIVCAATLPIPFAFPKYITCPICAICFPGDTKIDMPNNKTKCIKDIEIGERIKNNTIVGKLYVKPHIARTYNYNGIIVSGSHLVFEDDKWVRVEDSKNGIIESKYTELYCLITDNNTIYINGIKFRDYQETNDRDIQLTTNYAFAKQINMNMGCIKTPDDLNHCYYWGFCKNTFIQIDRSPVPIVDIINNPDNYPSIRGVVKIESPFIIYNYKGILVSGNTLVYEKNIWVRVFQSPISIKQGTCNTLYHIISDDNLVTAVSKEGSSVFRDFIESNNNVVNDKIDKLVENRLNIMFNFDNN